MAKKTDKAVTQLAKDLKKLRKQNEQLAKTLEKMREDQAEAHREVLGLFEERLAVRDAGPVEPVEGDHTPVDEGTREPETTGAEGRSQDVDAVEPHEEEGHIPDDGSDDRPEATEAAERRAKELGVDVSDAKGTGSGGRILVKDVEAAASGGR